MRHPRDPGALAAAALAFGLALPLVFAASGFMDEVTLLSHAQRVLAGEVIYRDFFEFLAPLSSWLPALLFLVAPVSITAARLLTSLGLALTAWQLYRLARLLELPPWAAVLPGALLVGALYATVPGYSHHWIVLPFVWGAVLAAAGGPAPRQLAAAGLGVGLAALTMQSDGLVLGGAIAAWLVLDSWLGRQPGLGARLGWLAAGVAVPLGTAAAYLAANHALGAAFYDVFSWPLAHYKTRGGINDVKYLTDLAVLLTTMAPDFKVWKWYLNALFLLYALLLPLGLAAALVLRGLDAVARGAWSERTARLGLVALVHLGLFAALLRGRADYMHAFCYLTPAALLAPVLAWRWAELLAPMRLALVRWLPLASVVAFLGAGLVLNGYKLATDSLLRPRLDGADGRLRQDPVVAYLNAHKRAGDRLAVFPLGGLYYFYALPPATRFTHMLDPSEGYYDQADYDRFWREVTAARPRFLVLAPSTAVPAPPPPVAGYALVADLPFPYLGKPAHGYVFERRP